MGGGGLHSNFSYLDAPLKCNYYVENERTGRSQLDLESLNSKLYSRSPAYLKIWVEKRTAAIHVVD